MPGQADYEDRGIRTFRLGKQSEDIAFVGAAHLVRRTVADPDFFEAAVHVQWIEYMMQGITHAAHIRILHQV